MDLVLNHLTNFSPQIEKPKAKPDADFSLKTGNISPSDIPEEIEIEKRNFSFKCNFLYSIMEGYENFMSIENDSFSFKYSRSTGRLYEACFDINSASSFYKNIKKIANGFEKQRNKDNLKLGKDLILQIFETYDLA